MAKVSVVVPNYNHARYLEQRIASILGQTYGALEILILDDASTDDSNEVIERLASDRRIRVLRNSTNSGSPFIQWNRGVSHASGEYVWIAESDDYADPNFLAELVPVLERNPAVGLAYCQSWRVDPAGNVLGDFSDWTADLDRERWQRDFINHGLDECRRFLLFKNTIPNASAVLFRRQLFLEVGAAPEDYRICADWVTWIKMLLRSDVAFKAARLNYFRYDPGSVTQQTKRNGVLAEETYRVAHFLRQSAGIPPELYERLCDALLYVWIWPILSGRGSMSPARMLRTYRLAWNFDHALLSRFLRRSVAWHPSLQWLSRWRQSLRRTGRKRADPSRRS